MGPLRFKQFFGERGVELLKDVVKIPQAIIVFHDFPEVHMVPNVSLNDWTWDPCVDGASVLPRFQASPSRGFNLHQGINIDSVTGNVFPPRLMDKNGGTWLFGIAWKRKVNDIECHEGYTIFNFLELYFIMIYINQKNIRFI